MTLLIDSHTHLESFHRAGRLEEILVRAEEAGVSRLITVGTDPRDWELYRDLVLRFPERIAYTVGIHPCDVDEEWEQQVALIEGYFASEVRPVALGEVGLDRFHLSKDPEQAEREITRQKLALQAQLKIAARLEVPVVVHSRGAFEECIDAIDTSGLAWEKVVFHCFTEGAGAMQRIRERGGRGSFTGVITYPKANEVREAALAQGLEALMIETDAPYLTPVPHRGKPNEPSYLMHTAEFTAGLFGISLEELAQRTEENTRAFYGLK
jgi:TatD DNase family protein